MNALDNQSLDTRQHNLAAVFLDTRQHNLAAVFLNTKSNKINNNKYD